MTTEWIKSNYATPGVLRSSRFPLGRKRIFLTKQILFEDICCPGFPPELAVHAQLGMPPLAPDPFWPALGFNPAAMFGLWNKSAAAPLHNLLSHYMLGGAIPVLGAPFPPPDHPATPSPPASPASASPDSRTSSIAALRLRAKEHLLDRRLCVAGPSDPSPPPSATMHET